MRTVLRSAVVAIAPLVFGYVSTQLGAHTSGLGNPTGDAGPQGIGLDHAFLIMLIPLIISALLLLLWARRTYPRDVATATLPKRHRLPRHHRLPQHRPSRARHEELDVTSRGERSKFTGYTLPA